jgi:calcineurin-like phosphoesterase family protein
MKTWFTSDTHFGHLNVINYCKRPFTGIEHMNAEMVRLWNETVAPEDTVYFLGDFSLGKQAVVEILPKLNGIKHLIAGNHDRCHPAHAKKEAKIAAMTQWYLEMGFATVQLELKINIAGHSVKLHHMPYSGDHTEMERYGKYRPKNEGDWLLCGHVHDLFKIKGKQINVGVDVWDFKPVSSEQIAEIINGA